MLMNFAVWLAVGAVVGAVAALLMRDDEDAGVFANVLVGVLGAMLAGWLFAPYVGLEVANARVFNFGALAVALVGAVALLAATEWARRGRRR